MDEDRSFSVGRVFGSAFALMRSNPMDVFGLTFLFGALPSALLRFGLTSFGMPVATFGSNTALSITLPVAFFSAVAQFVVLGMLVRAAVSAQAGTKASFYETINPALARFLPLVGAALLYTVGIWIGLMALVIPYFFLVTKWAVVAPVLVEERLGINAAFARSKDLTEGARSKVLGIILITLVLVTLFGAALGGFVAGLFSAPELAEEYNPSSATVVLLTLVGTVTGGFAAAVNTMLYVELRTWKNGPETGALSAIFE